LRTSRLRPGPSSLPRGQVTEIQRGRMLSATVEAVQEVGYSRLTVAQVIARAKVSRKTFYDVFLDREDCFRAAFDDTVERVGMLVAGAYEKESDWLEGVRGGLFALLSFLDAEPALARLCVVEAMGAGPRVLKNRAEIMSKLEQIVDLGRGISGEDGAKERTELPEITAEGIVGGIFTILHTRLIGSGREPLTELLGPLMSIVALPFLGPEAANAELTKPARPAPRIGRPAPERVPKDPLNGLEMRLTYRTVRVLTFIGEHPGVSNREVADGAGISDQGQISKLLTRLERLELIANTGEGQTQGGSNSWHLTERGSLVERATRAP
jgi:AcrR family transcriptional regulator